MYQTKKLHKFAEDSGGQLRIITSRRDLEQLLAARAGVENTTGGLLGKGGAHPLDRKLENLDLIEVAGHRIVGLHHFLTMRLAPPCTA